jgi:hypothetical protein
VPDVPVGDRQRVEKDMRRLDLEELVCLCEIIDVTLADLLRGRDPDAVRAPRAFGLPQS